jgi:hypothetical protein
VVQRRWQYLFVVFPVVAWGSIAGCGEKKVDRFAAGLCPVMGFAPCGAAESLQGTWTTLEFCDIDGQASSRPRICEGPGEMEPACQGGINERTCRVLHSVTAAIGPNEMVLTSESAGGIHWVFDDPCLAALAPSATPKDTCPGLVMPDRGVTCRYQTGQCACDGTTPPLQAGVETMAYATDGNRISLNSLSPATGTYCVTGDRLTILFDTPGSLGWSSWVLERV